MLDFAAVPFMLRARMFALQDTVFCLLSLLSPNSCLCDGYGKYSCILYCHQGASRMRGTMPLYHCILLIVQPCHVFTKHLLADTFPCMSILLCELCCVLCIDLLLVTSTCRLISGDAITWRSFCACEHHGARRRLQKAPWRGQGFYVAHSAQVWIWEVDSCR